ncbi:unnamed protein product [Sphenostylis stenocarpa]|uniref:NAC domain-containing protein n=1 Tax=Sphenostylis stenocarpa TaxID=92480 RepID=A0AA86SLF2_9FABA|nr:unnamed protein product [Sphenostylis stenocarpa]
MNSKVQGSDDTKKGEEVVLPGFRFHPTDEELVGFYLQRKVEKKPLKIELIKQVDIYKYDPWDLPSKICFPYKGRKYRNSVRPNRVTRSGFWKATGIDKSIYCVKEPHECIGLKKSLVYYRGSAGKGTKTDWMMHEFRLPPNSKSSTNIANATNNDLHEAMETIDLHIGGQIAKEVWTLCRIFKRTPSFKKYTPNLKDSTPLTKPNPVNSNTSTSDSDICKPYFICRDPVMMQQLERKPVFGQVDEKKHFFLGQFGQLPHLQPPSTPYPSFLNQNVEDYAFANENWDDLRSVVQFAIDPSSVFDCTETYIPPFFS